MLHSLQTRLLLLVLLAILPALGLTLATATEQRKLAIDEAEQSATRLVRLISHDQGHRIEETRHFLALLAQLPAVRERDAGACGLFLADLSRQHPRYASLAVAKPGGEVWCSTPLQPAPLPFLSRASDPRQERRSGGEVRPEGEVTLAGRGFFQDALRTRGLAVGDYQVGRATGQATVSLGYPVLDDTGGVRLVMVAVLNLDWPAEFATEARLPPGSALSVIDHHGTVLIHSPDPGGWTSRSARQAPIVQIILARDEGMAEATGLDGVPRLFAFTRLRGAAEGEDAHLSVGIPTAVAFAEADRLLARNLAALGLVAVLALATARIYSNRVIMRPVGVLVGVARRLSAGNLSVRTGLVYGGEELGALARAFDEMAASLEQRTAELRQFATVLDITADAVIVLDEALRIVRFNRGAEEIFGYRASEVIGESHDLLVPPRFLEVHRQRSREFAAAPESAWSKALHREVPGRRKDGTEFPAEATVAKLSLNGQTTFTIILRDVTARRRAEEALRETNQTLEALIQASPLAIVALDLQGNVTKWNPTAERIFGWREEEVLGRPLPIVPEDRWEEFCALHQGALRGELLVDTETRRRRKDGSLIDVSIARALLRDAKGAATGIVAIIADITEHKRAEDALREAHEQLERRVVERTADLVASNSRLVEEIAQRQQAEGAQRRLLALVEQERQVLAAVMAGMTEGLAVIDREGRVVSWNRRLEEMFDLSSLDLGRQPLTRDALVRELGSQLAETAVFAAFVDRALAGPEVEHRLDAEVVRPRRRDVQITTFPVSAPDGTLLGRGVLVRDTTAEREAARTKDAVVSIVSHELRTPMTSVLAFAELLLYREFPPEVQREAHETIPREARRLSNLLDDFLDIQRLESGRARLRWGVVRVGELVERVLENLAPQRSPRHRLVADLPADLPPVRADPDRVLQVLTNLVGNAIKYSPEGGEVRVGARVSDGALVVTIRDEGLGLPAEAKPHLFEKFYRVDMSDRREIGGTGLGLAIAREIVAQHGGRVWAESPGPGQGSTFGFTLPLSGGA
ncbi:MAG: PAS domain S-box protein [Chloroflexi bacterium]|nr:PAS domain S-box protein [Chloroflexota bacterium]